MKVHVEESLLLGAQPSKVFAVLADPRQHKHIMPDALVGYELESDSVISFSLRLSNLTRKFRVRIEPVEENKLLRECDMESGVLTEYRFLAHPDGTVVTISTEYDTANSISGFIEALSAPSILKRLYHEKLIKLGRYVLTV
ncbi:MAG: SRPBCC family protein [Candidatus Obscuribacterales bacterium]|nr:SRPBCC family protein [Candidatus Obscuribacterales bacterium]